MEDNITVSHLNETCDTSKESHTRLTEITKEMSEKKVYGRCLSNNNSESGSDEWKSIDLVPEIHDVIIKEEDVPDTATNNIITEEYGNCQTNLKYTRANDEPVSSEVCTNTNSPTEIESLCSGTKTIDFNSENLILGLDRNKGAETLVCPKLQSINSQPYSKSVESQYEKKMVDEDIISEESCYISPTNKTLASQFDASVTDDIDKTGLRVSVPLEMESIENNEDFYDKKDIADIFEKMEKMKVRQESMVSEMEKSDSLHKQQESMLLEKVALAERNATEWKMEMNRVRDKLLEENVSIRTDLTTRLEQLMKQCQASNKEKESMVMKYAMSESEVLKVKKQKESLEKKLKDQQKDKEILQAKLKTLMIDKSRICNTLDNKMQESSLASREIDKLREEISGKDIKIKWGQTKLRTEIDTHKDTQSKLEKALERITKHDGELQSGMKEAEKLVQSCKENENSRANNLDSQLREQKALLILERQKNEDLTTMFRITSGEFESLKTAYSTLERDALALKNKVMKYEQEREESEKLFTSLRTEVTRAKQGVADLSNQLTNSSGIAEQLQRERINVIELEAMRRDLSNNLEERTSELLNCRQKEAELLIFTQKLTDQNVKLQSQLSSIEAKTRLLNLERDESVSQMDKLRNQNECLKKEFNHLKKNKTEEVEGLKARLATKVDENAALSTQVSDLLNDIKVQQKKHQNATKDMSREILKLSKRMELYENNHSTNDDTSIEEKSDEQQIGSSFGVDSTPSSHSGSTPSPSNTPHDAMTRNLNAISSGSLNGECQGSCTVREPFSEEVPTEVLINRILKLQRNGVKRAEKIEFLEEHVNQLVSDLKKKNKIIHHYIMKEEPAALANSKADSAKAEIMKRGGIMASVYGSTPRDGAMTLDLSLEINRKLQVVLEDTLLKNITLKENLNTLGDEVANLSLQNSRASSGRK